MRFSNSEINATLLLKINLLKIKNYMHSHNREIATLLLVENIAEQTTRFAQTILLLAIFS
jgi:hypothetical protein